MIKIYRDKTFLKIFFTVILSTTMAYVLVKNQILFILLVLAVFGFSIFTMLSPKVLFMMFWIILPFISLFKMLFPFLPIQLFPLGYLGVLSLKIFLNKTINQEKFGVYFKPIDGVILLFLVILLLSTTNSCLPSIFFGIRGIKPFIECLLIYFLARKLITEKTDVYNLKEILLISAIGVALYGLRQTIFGLFPYEYFWIQQWPCAAGRYFSTMSIPPVYGNYMVILLLVLVIYWLNTRNVVKTKIFFIGAIVALMAIISTLQRNIFIGSIAMLFVASIAGIKIYGLNKRKMSFIVIVISMLVFGIISSITFSIVNKRNLDARILRKQDSSFLNSIQNMQGRLALLEAGHQEGSIVWRLRQLEVVVKNLQKYPLGAGVGFCNLFLVDNTWEGSFLGKLGVTDGRWKAVSMPELTGDSAYLRIILELGIPGIFCLLVLYYFAFKEVRTKIIYSKNIEDEVLRIFPFFIGCFFIFFLLIQLTVDLFSSIYVAGYFWLFLGILENYKMITNNR